MSPLIWIIVLIVLIVLAFSLSMDGSATPTIWSEYAQYLNSGHRYRIPFDNALEAWNTDAKRWDRRNAYISDHRKHASDDRVRVASWNVHQWKRADGTPESLEKLTKDLEMINADVVCFQEYASIGAPVEMLKRMYPHSSIEMLSCDDGGFGNAIYSKYPIISKRVINLPKTPPVFESRVCIHVELDVGNGSRPLHVFNTHLEVRNAYPNVHKHRYPQLFKIIEVMDAVREQNDRAHIILCGDFNTGWNTDVDRQFHKELTRSGYTNVGAWARKRAGTPMSKSGSYVTNMVRNTSIYGGFVDHIYEYGVRPVSFYELFTNSSDHYPIMTDVRLS